MNNDCPQTYLDIKASLGSLLFVWSQMERNLAKEITFLHLQTSKASARIPPKPQGIAAKLKAWQDFHAVAGGQHDEHQQIVSAIVDRMKSALELRNAVFHGLNGASVAPKDGKSHLTTILNGTKNTYSYSDLNRALSDVNQISTTIGELSSLSTANYSGNKSAHYASLRERLSIRR